MTTSGSLASLKVTVDSDGPKGAPARELQLDCASAADSDACKTVAKMSERGIATALELDLAPRAVALVGRALAPDEKP